MSAQIEAAGFPAWFPDDQHGYSVALCRCHDGPYPGTRRMGTPCRCERCGFITQDQFDFLRAEWEADVLRKFIARIPDSNAADWAPDYINSLTDAMIHARDGLNPTTTTTRDPA
jgi:hypothetical protein